MFNKSLAFGLLAAGLMVAPGAALADSQSQNSNQNTTQNGTAINGSVNAQSSESLNIQEQIQKTRDRVGGHGRRYGRPAYCGGSYSGQSQNSSQGTNQSGAALDGSDNAQSSSSVNDQKQVANNSRACR
ncbi:MAG: hypothetical protein HC836_14635 [Richelia sp. RM2_1_2]|nr:hypothetical protein [Richelia sp. SM1_7_0]NJN07717.1 hypothetical protein [Richelia sp. RM1_1_1]NJO27332.1 hypothetical protein [Richelia sp. SL_2_1]NJO59487.1 hypothetical protein [Richelia sp. RM2_1_2]